MKQFLFILFSLFVFCSFSQKDSLQKQNPVKKITHPKPKVLTGIKKDSTKKITITKPPLVKNIDTSTLTLKDSSETLLKDSSALTTIVKKDSIVKAKDSNTYNLLNQYPILSNQKPELMITAFRQVSSKDFLFYALLAIVIFFAIVKLIFPRYVKNIFGIVFQTQFRQGQTKEQLSQDNVASMLLNIMFILTASFFIALSLTNCGFIKHNFWQAVLVSVILLSAMYWFKLLFTNFLGWIFNKSAAAKSYTFLVFIINKISGILLLPIIFLIAFSEQALAHKVVVISLYIVAFLLLIRLFLTFKTINSILKINAIHFFLYFCCVEILPLLLIFKFLNNYISSGVQL